jgi:hypothetical protein
MFARALLVLLAVLNLGVGAWWWAHVPAASQAATAETAVVPRLQLASERPADAGEPVAPPPAPLREDAVCIALGPFPDATSAARAQTQLSPQVLASRLVERAAAGVRGWRVLVPPQPSRAEADAVAARIGAAGFSDFLVPERGRRAPPRRCAHGRGLRRACRAGGCHARALARGRAAGRRRRHADPHARRRTARRAQRLRPAALTLAR